VTIRDLRRTVADALLNRMKAQPWIVDHVVLGHVRPKLLRTYMPTLLLDEAREALERWGEELERILAVKAVTARSIGATLPAALVARNHPAAYDSRVSVVAACALIDRVLITADCRGTVRTTTGRELHYDTLLKLFKCGPFSVVGFVGNDVGAASSIVAELCEQTYPRRRRQRWIPGHRFPAWHPQRLARWMPRFLKREYAKTGTREQLTFLLAQVIPEVSSVVTANQVKGLMRRLTPGMDGRPGTMDAWPIELLLHLQESGADAAAIKGTFAPRIQVMESPMFVPRTYDPLQYVAIGSGGQPTGRGIDLSYDLIYGNQEFAETCLDDIVVHYCREANVTTVGGLRPTYSIERSGVMPLTYSSTRFPRSIDPAGTQPRETALLFDKGEWVQIDEGLGLARRIVPPWKVLRRLRKTFPAELPFPRDYHDD
jgi:hypothetical protein